LVITFRSKTIFSTVGWIHRCRHKRSLPTERLSIIAYEYSPALWYGFFLFCASAQNRFFTKLLNRIGLLYGFFTVKILINGETVVSDFSPQSLRLISHQAGFPDTWGRSTFKPFNLLRTFDALQRDSGSFQHPFFKDLVYWSP
jgi:hypothetical protein